MMMNKDSTEKTDWQKADSRVLGQILAAQNVDFVLPDISHIAEFFAETLNIIPGVTSCRVCLADVTVQRGEMYSEICEGCQASRKRAAEQDDVSSLSLGFDFKCGLDGQPGMHISPVASLHHHFGFFIFQISDFDVFYLYEPFIGNLANYIALSLENRLQREILKNARDEMERKVEERTRDLVAINQHLQNEIETRRQAENALKESEKQIRQLVDASPVAMVVSWGAEEHVEWVNDKFIDLFGYTIEDMPDVAHWWPIAYPDEKYREEIKTQWQTKVGQAIREKGQIEPIEAMVTCKDGSHRYIEFRFSSIGQKNLITFVDLTERKRVEQALRENETQFRAIFESSVDAIGVSKVGVHTFVNPAYLALFGYANNTELNGKPILDLIAPSHREQILENVRRRVSGQAAPIAYETRGLRKDDSEFDMDVHTSTYELSGEIYSIAILRDITERKRAEEQLLASEQLFRALVENSPDFIARYDREFRRIYVNPAIQRLFTSSTESVLGQTPTDQTPLYAPQVYIEHLQKAIETATESTVETPFRTAQGEMHWGQIRFVPEFDSDGKVTSVLAIGRDVHEIKENERRFRMLAENFPDFVIRFARDGRYVYINPAFEKAFGIPAETVFGKTLHELPRHSNPEQNGALLALIQRTFDEDVSNELEVHWDTETGERIFEIRLVPEKDAAGNVVSVLSIARNVTERKQAQKALTLFRSLIDHANDIIEVADPETGRFLDVNERAYLAHGYTREEYLALTVPQINTVVAARSWKDTMDELRRSGSLVRESQHRRKDGSIFPVEININYVRLDRDYVLAVVRDITERKQAEQALRESEERLRQIASSLREVIWLRDVQTRQVLYVNPAFEELTGQTCESFFENRDIVIDAIHPDDKEGVIEALEQRFKGVPYDKEHRIIHLDGSVRWVSSRIFPVQNEAGEVYRWASIMEDITERKQYEREREAIITVSTALRQAKTRTEILNVILDQLIDLFDADGAVLVLPDTQTGGLVDEMGRGVVGERMVGLNIPPGKGVCDWVITNKKPYLSNQADQDALFYRPDLLGKSHCLISVPLIAQEQVIGVLWVARQFDFVEQDLRLLTAIADIAANAIHRVTLHEQTERQLHRLIALHQIDLAISTNIDLNITLNVILMSVKDELEVDAVSILLLNPITHTLDYTAGIGFRTHNIEQSHVRLGSGCAGRAAQELCTVSCLELDQVHEPFNRFSFLAGEEFVSHYATPLMVKGQVKGVLEIFHRAAIETEHAWLSYFETLATQSAIAIENASLFENLQRSNMELTLAYDATIEGWSRALDLRDRETEGHTQRVAKISLELAEKMGMSDADKLDLWRGALLHDIGKMGVPDSILLKPGPLSDDEWKIMQQHPLYAYRMLSPISYLKRALEIPYCHHEKWDGSGYPRGLKGEEIPLSARVFSVVDVFDALTSDRPYSKAWSHEQAYRYIKEQAGKYFDPQIVKMFLETR